MERCFSGIMKSLQIQAGLLDPKLLEPEKYRSGIFLETDTGAVVDIRLVDADGAEQQLSGLVPAEELVRFASLDLTDYHSAIQQLWQEHPLFEEKSPVPYAEYEDLETKILHFPEWLNSIDTVSGFYAALHLRDAMAMENNGSSIFPSEKGMAVLRALDEPCRAQKRLRNLMELGFADFERGTQLERYQALEESYPNLMHQPFPCRPLPFSSRRRYAVESIFELYLLELLLYFQQDKKRIARCECCWQYFIPKTKKETHYCDRIVDGLACKKLGPVLKAKADAEMDEALRIYNQLRHRMEERRNRYEDARSDQRADLIQMSATQYEAWITAAIPLRDQYLAETISAEEFLRGIDLFHELETYKVGKRVLPVPNETRWRGEIKANLDFDPAIMYQGAMTLNLSGDDPQWEIFSPQEQQDAARGGHGSLREKYHKGKLEG